jgi:uncharacterized protein
MPFEWDDEKDKANRERHGLSFGEVVELFTSGVDFLDIYDENHSDEEDRFVAIGPIHSGVVIVVYTERQDDVVRIISARSATKKEIQLFHQHLEGKRD